MTPKLDENCTKKKTIDQNYELQCKNLRYYPKESKHLKRKKMKKWGIVQKFQGYFKLKNPLLNSSYQQSQEEKLYIHLHNCQKLK